MSHVMFGGLTHEPAIELARRLVALTPAPLEHVFFADSGSVAVEVAIKMCLQAAGPGRARLLALRGGYHGDTFGAMAVCDPVDGMHHLFASVLPGAPLRAAPAGRRRRGARRAPTRPSCARCSTAHGGELAAAIVEPLVQGAGGMWFYSPGYLRLLRELCDAHGVLLIFDEIATGFGRTGTLFAADRAGVAPDVMCVGKALTGGYLTLAATLCSAAVAARDRRAADARPDLHGEPARLRRRPGQPRAARARRLAGPGGADRGRPARGARGRRRDSPACARCARSARSA